MRNLIPKRILFFKNFFGLVLQCSYDHQFQKIRIWGQAQKDELWAAKFNYRLRTSLTVVLFYCHKVQVSLALV